MKTTGPEAPFGVKIRYHLLPGDMGTVIGMHGKLYHEAFGFGLGFETYVAESFASFAKDFKEGKDRIWLAEKDQECKAFIALVHRGKATAQLRYFIITPDLQGKGLGKFLIKSFMAYARKQGYRKIYLWTTSHLKAAASLYHKEGFSLVEEKQSHTFGIPLLEQRYELELRPEKAI